MVHGYFIHALQLTEKAAFNVAFPNLKDIISTVDGSSLETYGLPLPTRDANERVGQEYSRVTGYSYEDQQRMTESNFQHLISEPAHIHHDVMKKIRDD